MRTASSNASLSKAQQTGLFTAQCLHHMSFTSHSTSHPYCCTAAQGVTVDPSDWESITFSKIPVNPRRCGALNLHKAHPQLRRQAILVSIHQSINPITPSAHVTPGSVSTALDSNPSTCPSSSSPSS